MGKRNTSSKVICVRKFGWKRVARNIESFGWKLGDAEEHTEISEKHEHTFTLTDTGVTHEHHVQRETKVRIWLSFFRHNDQFANLKAIKPLEILFNLVFLIRRIIGFLLSLMAAACFLLVIFENAVGGNYEYSYPVVGVTFSALFVWIVLNFVEVLLAKIAQNKLKYKA